jgi:transcriptional regulator with XRE-family HTH domain
MFVIKDIKAKEMKKYRLWLNMSQEAIAEAFGVAGDTYARWERDEQKPESPSLVALAFESLLNRRLMVEADRLHIERFEELTDQTEFYLNEIEKLQNFRRSRVKQSARSLEGTIRS